MMFIVEPQKIAQWSLERLNEGYLQNRMSIAAHALTHHKLQIPDDVARSAVDFVKQKTDVQIDCEMFLRIIDLYPYAKAKLADYGWGDTEVRDITLDVIAHFYLGTRWPLSRDECNRPAFLERLKYAVESATRYLLEELESTYSPPP